MLTCGPNRVLMDCGMFQGRRKESERKNRTLPFDPGIITNAVLSHAHIDHSGRFPLFTKNGFSGHIFSTRASCDAAAFLLRDSAKIQESDADYLNYKTMRSFLHQVKTSPRTKKVSNREQNNIKKLLKRGRHELDTDTINELLERHRLERIEPLYTMEEAEKSLEFFSGYPYRNPVTVGEGVQCTFYDAGHILGSAVSIFQCVENGDRFTVGYTGDIGRFGKPILKDPTTDFAEEDRDLDLLIMESTYGDRIHGPVQDLRGKLKLVIDEAVERGGSILIPSFAYGRTQELVYTLHELYDDHQVPRLPIYVDSPLAMKLTAVYGEHPETYDAETHETFLEKGANPFIFDFIHFVESVEQSMELMRDERPHIVISASGMLEGGRILHHLRYKVHNERNTILIVGYMAKNTLGRRLQELSRHYEETNRTGKAPLLKFLNKEYPLRAHVVQLDGFSAHGDKEEMIRFVEQSNLSIKRIALVHGEEDQSLAFAKNLQAKGFSAFVPRAGESVTLKK